MDGAAHPSPSALRRLAVGVGIAIGLGGFVAALYAASTGMRHVMVHSGGFCANGGPYVISSHCTAHDTLLLGLGLPGLFLFGGILLGTLAAAEGPVLATALLAWGALFGLLGWNFIDLGALRPPPHTSGGGWIVSGVVFWLMALGGLVPAAKIGIDCFRRHGQPEPPLFAEPLVRARR